MPQSGGELCLISQGEAVEKASSLGWDRLVPKTVGSSWPQEVSRWVATRSLRVSHEPQGLGEQPDYLYPLAKLAERKWNKTNETVALQQRSFAEGERLYWRTAKQGDRRQSSDLSPQWAFVWGIYCGSREQDEEAALKHLVEMKKFQEFCAHGWLSFMPLHGWYVQYQDSSTCYTW